MTRRFRGRPDPPAPRGGPSSRAARCPECGAEEALLEVFLVAGGQDVSFAVCSKCEWRRWGGREEQVSRSDVLHVVAADARAEAEDRAARRALIRRGTFDGPLRLGEEEEELRESYDWRR